MIYDCYGITLGFLLFDNKLSGERRMQLVKNLRAIRQSGLERGIKKYVTEEQFEYIQKRVHEEESKLEKIKKMNRCKFCNGSH